MNMRKPRVLKKNAVYHVTARANRGEMIFCSPVVRRLFLAFLEKAKKKYPFHILNFCVMGNHIHLIIRPKNKDALPKIMQWILGNFAKAWNKLHGVRGHLWGGRYFSKIIEEFKAFIKTFDYICQNPVKALLVRSAEEWEFGGLWHFIEQKREIFDVHFCLKAVYLEYYRFLVT